jgi:hypothetical protein
MPVQYVRVKTVTDLFVPVSRSVGNIAIIGSIPTPTPAPGPTPTPAPGPTPTPAPGPTPTPAPPTLATANTPVEFTTPDPSLSNFGDLGKAIQTAFRQTPGPSVVYGVSIGAGNIKAALDAVATLNVQLVVIANTPVDITSGASGGAIDLLASHVTTVSQTGGDGLERIGVVMLGKGVADPSVVTSNGNLVNDRMVYVAHNSTDDVAAAVAGTIAGFDVSTSLLLKQVNVNSPPFAAADIDKINGAEDADAPPAGKGINWLTSPALIPGGGVFMGEGYNGNPGGKKFIDVVRTIDDVSFRLKARLIDAIGNVRISRSGLRAVIAQMEATLNPLVAQDVLESFSIAIPVLALLDKDPATLSASDQLQIKNIQTSRLVEIFVSIGYAGAIHRLTLNLNFS